MENDRSAAMDGSDEAGLWRRWRAATTPGGSEPSPLELAGYAENRLSEAAAEAIEAWLAAHPLAAEDVLAARRAAHSPLPAAAELVVAQASALVGGAEILPFRKPAAARSWRQAASWAAMAASIAVASLVGYTLSNETFVLSGGGQSSTFSQQLIDPPTGLFNALVEDSNT
jgi:hypothetical protein